MSEQSALELRREKPATVTRHLDGGDTMQRMFELFSAMGRASVLPRSVQGPADAAIIAAYGASLGMDPLQSLYGLHFIEGRPTLGANSMAALVKGNPTCEWMIIRESTPQACCIETMRRGDPGPVAMSYTIEEAEAAGLTGPSRSGKPSNWQKFPADMLRARCVTRICRAVYPDVVGGIYDPEELRPEAQHAAPVIEVQPEHCAAEQRHPKEWPAIVAEDAADHAKPDGRVYLSDVEERIIGENLRRWPDPLGFDMSSSDGQTTYHTHRLEGGRGWTCTCRAGENTKRNEPVRCRHALASELRLYQRIMGPAWATIAGEFAPPADGKPNRDASWVDIEPGDKLANMTEAVDMCHAWRDAQ